MTPPAPVTLGAGVVFDVVPEPAVRSCSPRVASSRSVDVFKLKEEGGPHAELAEEARIADTSTT